MAGKNSTKSGKGKNPRVILIIILCIIVIALVTAVIFLLARLNSLSEQQEMMKEYYENLVTTEAGVRTDESRTTEASDYQVTDVEVYYNGDVCIPTAYVTLHFPEQWSDCLRVEEVKKGTSYMYTFYGLLSGKLETGLFCVHFNEDGEMAVGKFQTADQGEVYINLTPLELSFDNNWTNDEIDMICAMQESTNYMMDVLSEDPAFTRN